MKPADKAPGGGSGRPEENEKPRATKCALCGKPVVEAYRPFCSKRCADIDLGRWLKGEYAVSGQPGDAGKTPSGER